MATANVNATPFPCQLLKNFSVSRLLGAGAFGAVIQVKNKLDEKEYAIKVAAMDAFAGVDVSREVKNLAAIPQHKNLVLYSTSWEDRLTAADLDSIKTICKTRGAASTSLAHFRVPSGSTYLKSLCIQMELCGKDLRQWLEAQTVVKDKQSIEIFLQLQSGLRHIHKHNLIHRDLKPDNIFFDKNNSTSVKIGDLGLAVAHSTTRSALHSNGTGTTCYLAPEQMTSSSATHTRYDKMVDIFASGLILLELFYPQIQANRNNNSYHVLDQTFYNLKHGRQVPSSITGNWPVVSELILQMTESDKKNRPSADEIFDTFKKPSPNSSSISDKLSAPSSVGQRSTSPPVVVHNEVGCDHCGMNPIVGIRYKCSVCSNLNLCQSCENIPGVHAKEHGMIKMKTPAPSNTTAGPVPLRKLQVYGVHEPIRQGTENSYLALQDFEAEDTTEVSFRKGDLIIDCAVADMGWMAGTVQRTGKRGQLPANYVTCSQGTRYTALYDYNAGDTTEVSFSEGDIIIDCTVADMGWKTGTVQRTGRRGNLPANFVAYAKGLLSPNSQGTRCLAVSNYTAKDTTEVSFGRGDLIIDCTIADLGWKTGTVQRTGRRGNVPANFLVNEKGIDSSNSPGTRFLALHDYEAKDTTKVSFRKGDVITDCTVADMGWKRGTVQRTGRHGKLPANFVVFAYS